MGITTTTNYGRAQVAWPDFAHEGGTALHTKIVNGIKKLSDQLNCRWTDYQTLADTLSFNFTHNFLCDVSELQVVIYEGDKRISDFDQAKNYTITQLNTSEIAITNISGGSKTFHAYVMITKLDNDVAAKGYASTPSNTLTTLCGFASPVNKTIWVTGTVVARQNSTTSNVYKIEAMVENAAGIPALSVVRTDYLEENATMDCVFAIVGADVQLQVTGPNATAVEWFGTIESKEI
jgi:hypothetical protein